MSVNSRGITLWEDLSPHGEYEYSVYNSDKKSDIK